MSVERTIAFIDLAGFTALTEVHGDDAAVDLVDGFLALVRDAINADAELVKSIGDAVMLSFPGPEVALDAVRNVFEACYAIDAFPEPRAGLHHGTVVERAGDWFGATVNLAARVASRAGSGQTFGTQPIAVAADRMGIDTVDVGEHALRNVLDPVALWAIELCPAHVDLSVDPVCRMRVGCQAAIGRIRYKGVEYSFCSLPCVRAFAVAPDRYVSG